MKRLVLIITSLVVIPSIAFSASTGWAKDYRTSIVDVKQTTDRNYIVVGWADPALHPLALLPDPPQLWLAKIDKSGDTIWTHLYGGNKDEMGYCVQQTSDGGYIITGFTDSYAEVIRDIWLLKTNPQGDIIWTRTYDGGGLDYGNSVIQTSDDGYLITGNTGSLGLIKTNSTGDLMWTRLLEGLDISCQETLDGGYIIVGLSYAYDEDYGDVWLHKTDAYGNTQWTKHYGGASTDIGSFVQQTEDGGYIVIGSTSSFGAEVCNVWLLKTDEYGDTIWTQIFDGGTGSCVRVHPDGGYIITCEGWTLIRTNDTGDSLWTRKYNANWWEGVGGRSVDVTEDGGYIVAGIDAFLYKTDFNGDIGDVGVIEVDSLEDINYGETYSVKATIENFGRTTEAFSARCVITFRDLDAPEIRVDTVYWDTVFVDSLEAGQTRTISFKDYDFPQKGLYWMYATTMLDGDANPSNDAASSYMGEGVQEQPVAGRTPRWEVLASVGSRIVLRYSDSPDGFHVDIYNAAGQKVDELHSSQTSGTVSWGEGFLPGVYFIVPETQGAVRAQKVVLIR